MGDPRNSKREILAKGTRKSKDFSLKEDLSAREESKAADLKRGSSPPEKASSRSLQRTQANKASIGCKVKKGIRRKSKKARLGLLRRLGGRSAKAPALKCLHEVSPWKPMSLCLR